MNISSLADGLSNPCPSPRDQVLPPRFHLPLVSVIIVNYNYGRYLEEAVESVFAQSYPNVECVVVDNASTDETPAVLAMLREHYPQLLIVERAANDGQNAASLDGFAQSSGHYVIFLDADDVLLPSCVETHIYVHLSARIHVGFTAGDMLQARNGNVIVSTGEAMNVYLRSNRGIRPNLWRPYLGEPGWPSPRLSANLRSMARYVPPLCTKWIWSPTSGLCYRRDAIALFADNPQLPRLWTATDMYFAHSIGGWCGSVLIDEPVFIYRLHGSNIFSQQAQLHHTLNYQPGGAGDYNDRAKALIVDQLISRSVRFSQNLLFKLHLVALLFGLDGKEADQTLPRWGRRSSVAHRLVLHFDDFSAQFGRAATQSLMLLFRVPLSVIWRCGRHGTRPDRAA